MLQNVHVRTVLSDGRVEVVWSPLDVKSERIEHGQFCVIPKDRIEGDFKPGQRAQALVETDESIVVKLLQPPKVKPR